MRLTRVGFVAVVLLTAGGCTQTSELETTAGDESPAASSSRSPRTSLPPLPTESQIFQDQHKADRAKTRELFPRGYPKVVAVSTLPFELRHSYNVQGSRAVALAPGVWTPLPDGSSMIDVATMGWGDGRCAAVRAYEDEYLDGRRLEGDCW